MAYYLGGGCKGSPKERGDGEAQGEEIEEEKVIDLRLTGAREFGATKKVQGGGKRKTEVLLRVASHHCPKEDPHHLHFQTVKEGVQAVHSG